MSRWGRDIDDREDVKTDREPEKTSSSISPIKKESLHFEYLEDNHTRDYETTKQEKLPDDERLREDASCDPRERVLTQDRSYLPNSHDLDTMEDIGKFRVIDVKDIEHFRFQGNEDRSQKALHSLSKQGLIQQKTLFSSSRHENIRVVALTDEGKRVVAQEKNLTSIGSRPEQKVYSGIKKIAEVNHDSAIYRMYQAEARKIRSSGGRIRRVVLDYELKKQIYSPLAKARDLSPESFQKRQEDIARQNGLRVVDGKIPIPDLRIEYENPEGRLEKVDLELTTDRYKSSQLAEKSRAGFKLYSIASSHSRGSAVWEDRELIKGILHQ
jgi:hypothetical protein